MIPVTARIIFFLAGNTSEIPGFQEPDPGKTPNHSLTFLTVFAQCVRFLTSSPLLSQLGFIYAKYTDI
jgi:hypothetical protein